MAEKKNDNLALYERVRKVPQEAQKTIGGGRLKGMTDINPMWRIKKLTEEFGMCGIGWYYDIIREWVEFVDGSTDATANVEIKLYVKKDGEWSKGIAGIGGSMLASNEKNGLYVNDECFKMALTDAISVACKELGFGADVYWNKDTTKYSDTKVENFNKEEPKKAPAKAEQKANVPTQEQLEALAGMFAEINDKDFSNEIKAMFNIEKSLTEIKSMEDYNTIVGLVVEKMKNSSQNEK